MLEFITGYIASKVVDYLTSSLVKYFKPLFSRDTDLLSDTYRGHHINLYVTAVEKGNDPLNALTKESDFPYLLRSAITEPNLDGLIELIRNGSHQEALKHSEKQINDILEVIEKNSDLEERYSEALRIYLQRLLFIASNSASWLGQVDLANRFWRRVQDLGPIDSNHYLQAAITAFNLGLKKEFDYIIDSMEKDSSDYQMIPPFQAFVEEDWHKVDELLIDTSEIDYLLLRVEARLKIIDAKDVTAVQLTADLLESTDHDTKHSIINLKRTELTYELLNMIISNYTPLDFDRSTLINQLIRRLHIVLSESDPTSMFHVKALKYLRMIAVLLKDIELIHLFQEGIQEIDGTLRASIFISSDSDITVDTVNHWHRDGKIDLIQTVLLKAEIDSSMHLYSEIETDLRMALYSTPDSRVRAQVLSKLIRCLNQQDRFDEIQELIESTPLLPADKWLLKVRNLEKNILTSDLINQVEEFPLDVDVIEFLARYYLSKVTFEFRKDQTTDSANSKDAKASLRWTSRLIEILPTKSSKLLYAYSLFATHQYDDLLSLCRKSDSIYAMDAAEWEAWALIGLDKINEGIEQLIWASQKYPESIDFVINAAVFLINENRPEEAVKILEPKVSNETQNHRFLSIYAHSLRKHCPNSRDISSDAYDLFAQSYNLNPDPQIAMSAWFAAKAANRESEAIDYFTAMLKGAHSHQANTPEDIVNKITQSKDRPVKFENSLDMLKDLWLREQKKMEILSDLLNGHALSYSDFFRHTGRSWEYWSRWVGQYESRNSSGGPISGHFSILSKWPYEKSTCFSQNDVNQIKLLLDQTAIMTLGLLGSETAEHILTSLQLSYISDETIQSMSRDLQRINGQLLSHNDQSYIDAKDLIMNKPNAIGKFSTEIESALPDDQDMGPFRVDIGVAIHYKTVYIMDVDDDRHKSIDPQTIMTSSALLASFNSAGLITEDQANEAEVKYSNTFRGWKNEVPQSIQESYVFDEPSLITWIDAGFTEIIRDYIMVGPIAWSNIRDRSERYLAMKLSHDRLTKINRLVKDMLLQGTIEEIELMDLDGHSDEESENFKVIEDLWYNSLRIVRTAMHHGFQLWADDRFYSLLLGYGGPEKIGQEIVEICSHLASWEMESPHFSTFEVIAQLISSKHLLPIDGQKIAYNLFKMGYRTSHPLVLMEIIRQFPVEKDDGISRPIQNIIHSINDLQNHLPELFDNFYPNRKGLIRIASANLAEHFIVAVWKNQDIKLSERQLLAKAILQSFEDVSTETGLVTHEAIPDPSFPLIWSRFVFEFYLLFNKKQISNDLFHTCLQWLGKEALDRPKYFPQIVRDLEDNILIDIKSAIIASNENQHQFPLSDVITAFIFPNNYLLTETKLVSTYNILMRKTVAMLTNNKMNPQIDITYQADYDQKNLSILISEEEHEEIATEVLKRAAGGDHQFSHFVKGVDLLFTYLREPTSGLIDQGFPDDEKLTLPVRFSLFRLLWLDLPSSLYQNIVNIIIYQMAPIDPFLASQISEEEDNLLSDDKKLAEKAKIKIGIELLKSGYFDIQRNLIHAVHRLRSYDLNDFMQFLGWIGADRAQKLISHPIQPKVLAVDGLLVSWKHLRGRSLLADFFDDGSSLIENINQQDGNDEYHDEDETAIENLVDWLSNAVDLCENSDDPFEASWALYSLLLVISSNNLNLQLIIREPSMSVLDWVTSYLDLSLNPDKSEPTEIQKHIQLRSLLASSTMRLATYSCSGEKHLQTCEQAYDPQMTWLNNVWLLSTKLQQSLLELHDGIAGATDTALSAIQHLELDSTNISVMDDFDPLAFGKSGDNLGVTLTITAMLKTVDMLSKNNNNWTWCTNSIFHRIEELANQPSQNLNNQMEEYGNCLGLNYPLREKIAAMKLLKALQDDP